MLGMFLRSSLFTMVTLVTTVTHVFADTPWPPYSHSKQTSNGQYLFVMIAPIPSETEKKRPTGPEPERSKIPEIRKTYSRSGLYRNDGTNTPLWTVNWYARGFEPLSDGIHLVRKGPWASSPDSEAVAFFANGELIRSYTVRELVAKPQLMPHSVSHFTWRFNEELDDQDKTYKIITKHFEYYWFDVTTGEIVSSFRPYRWASGFLGFLAISAISYWWWRRKKRA
jgi:hypothetical protein